MHPTSSANENEKGRSLKRPISTSSPDSVISALTTVKRIPQRDGSTLWSLVVKKCPFCSKSHVHGGGTGEMPLLGTRESHCLRDWREYELVAVDGGEL